MSTDTSLPLAKNEDSARGFAFALAAYLFWGVLPIYMKALGHIPAAEVIAHRIIWSVPVAGIVLLFLGRTSDLKAALKSPRTIAMASVTACLVTVNWGTYVWAVGNGHTLDAALGYFINPLLSIALGSLLLKEKMSAAQVVAIVLAAIAVIILAVDAGRPPWIALLLSLSWGFYAFFRKTLPVGPNQGFFLEVLLLSLPALGYIIYLESRGEGHLYATGLSDTLLLAGCGLVTALPLMIYANGAKLLRL
jgi:chloramphenicol-sensitive protein RarD